MKNQKTLRVLELYLKLDLLTIMKIFLNGRSEVRQIGNRLPPDRTRKGINTLCHVVDNCEVS